MTTHVADFTTRIDGIPCGIKIDSIYEDWDFPERRWPVVEFTVLDRKGYVADWLANKMTDSDIDRIYELALNG